MEIINKNIDHGKAFDWGKTSEDYAKYRDIYPKEFYAKHVNVLCILINRLSCRNFIVC